MTSIGLPSFVQAYFPYTLAASTGRLSLLAQGYDDQTVIQLLRTQPHFFEPAFYVPRGATCRNCTEVS
ncbi:MAG: hypothetical protein IGS03_09395 [Candidatus Sericytochromatia bacterium]|nr:hypothetical protein [Candidatus Sericytochromatia bacterium]